MLLYAQQAQAFSAHTADWAVFKRSNVLCIPEVVRQHSHNFCAVLAHNLFNTLFKGLLFFKEPQGYCLKCGRACRICCACGGRLLFSGADIDYGIAGVLLPVTVRLLDFRSYGAEGLLAEIYCAATVFLLFFIGLIVVSVTNGILQFFCLFSIIPLLFYSGKRGKYKLKYLFYTFYPLHLAILAAIFLILNPDYLNSIL